MINQEMLTDVLIGLKSNPKFLSPKYFYDKKGAELFEKICQLKEYYPTRTEIGILEENIDDISKYLGSEPIIYEYGSGASTKTKILLKHLKKIKGYVPIDICEEYLRQSSSELRVTFPNLSVAPIHADFSKRLALSDPISLQNARSDKMIFFPGSTIGNFTPDEAKSFLINAAQTIESDGKLLIGVDLVKDVQVLEKAYNDSEGVTGEFNLNILKRINQDLNANFVLSDFEHHAFFNKLLSRIEMHLIAKKNTQVELQGNLIQFLAGESIHTENSYKYEISSFIKLAEDSGFAFIKKWTDLNRHFGVFLFQSTHQDHKLSYCENVIKPVRQTLTCE